jgi:TPP-dependent indolepyruvate ferredoxin oxidoreductase alpha subunit
MLKLGFCYPFHSELKKNFITNLDGIMAVEEVEYSMEKEAPL